MNNEVVEQIERLVKDVINNSVHTAMPGKIVSLDESNGLMSVQPTGSFYCGKVEMDYPVVPGVPICTTANNSGIAICSPIKEGDDVLLVCAEQSLSAFISETSEAQSDEKFELTNCVAISGIQRAMPDALKEANEKDAIVFMNGDNVKVLITKDEIDITNGEGIKILVSNNFVQVTNGDMDLIITNEDISIKGKVSITGELEVDGNITSTGRITGDNMEV